MKCTIFYTYLLPLLSLLPSHQSSSSSSPAMLISSSSSLALRSIYLLQFSSFALFPYFVCTIFCFVYLTLSHMKSSFISNHLHEQKMCKQVLLFNFFFVFNELKSTIYQAKQLTSIIRFSLFRQIVDKCTYLSFNILQKLF